MNFVALFAALFAQPAPLPADSGVSAYAQALAGIYSTERTPFYAPVPNYYVPDPRTEWLRDKPKGWIDGN